MAGYCEFSDLPSEICAHCKQGLRTLPLVTEQDDRDWHGAQPGRGNQDAPLAPGQWFPARWPGHCSGECGRDIVPGDMIRANGTGGWVCENCG